MYICIYVYMYICIYAYMYRCIYVYVYTCLCIYIASKVICRWRHVDESTVHSHAYHCKAKTYLCRTQGMYVCDISQNRLFRETRPPSSEAGQELNPASHYALLACLLQRACKESTLSLVDQPVGRIGMSQAAGYQV